MENQTNQNQAPNKYLFLVPITIAVAIIIGVALGIYINKVTGGKTNGSGFYSGSKSDKLNEIMNLVNAKYVDTTNGSILEEEAINAYLQNLDPHSIYIPASELTGVNEDMQGHFDGIGIEFRLKDDTIVVVNAISGGPSELVGIKGGDKIIKINDTIVAGVKINNDGVMHKLRGLKGTKVKVAVKRNGYNQLINFTITRDVIPQYSVDVAYKITNDIGYIKINRFSATTTDEFGKKLYELNQLGIKKLIVDLRQNPGGYLNAAVDIADELLGGKKLVVYTKGNSSPRKDYIASRPGQFEDGDLVVLIDEGSASASEILSGAIQDHDRGTIIGRRSFGKGLVQDQYSLADGSALRLTIARYYTPSGRCIQRNYGKNTEDYYNDLMVRYQDGEMYSLDSFHVKDTTKYYTDKGRVVYAGGGIIPDVFVPLDTTLNWNYLAEFRKFIPDYVLNKYASNEGVYVNYKNVAEFQKSFVIDNLIFNDFLAFAYSKGTAKNEKALANISPMLKNILKSYIAKQKWNNDGYYPVINESDKTVQKAIQVLNKK
ncbi:MAG: S41 family peptidase [Bacteroidota bacterium]